MDLSKFLVAALFAGAYAYRLQLKELASDGSVDVESLLHLVKGADGAYSGATPRLVFVSFTEEEMPPEERLIGRRENASIAGPRIIDMSPVAAGSIPTVEVRRPSPESQGSEAGDLPVAKMPSHKVGSQASEKPQCLCGRLGAWAAAVQPVFMALMGATLAVWAWTHGITKGIRCCGLLGLLAYVQYRGLAGPA
jgi:hypothetical protein